MKINYKKILLRALFVFLVLLGILYFLPVYLCIYTMYDTPGMTVDTDRRMTVIVAVSKKFEEHTNGMPYQVRDLLKKPDPGNYPDEVNISNWRGPYLEGGRYLQDAWGNEFEIYYKQNDHYGFILYSPGGYDEEYGREVEEFVKWLRYDGPENRYPGKYRTSPSGESR